MRGIFKIIFGILGLALLPLTIILTIILIRKLEPTRFQETEDLFEQEEKQYATMGTKLRLSANPDKAEMFKVKTSFGDTEAIRWTQKHKKVVVFVHGVMCDKYTSSKAVALWSKLGYDVVSFDGYGWGSTRKYGVLTNYAGREQIRLLNAVINEVIDKYSLGDVVVHGESMGGGTIYKYIQMFGTKKVHKFIVDAGYLSFYENFTYLAAETIGTPLALMIYPFMWIQFLIKGYPLRRQIKRRTLARMEKRLLHIHSNTDVRVPYKYIKAEIKNFKLRSEIAFYEKKVRHVRGYYDSKEELETMVGQFIKHK
ncbi:MAG: alpha/beta fold hydrolase [Mycoplasmataceae bacterium]|nr:alpha/beta fold hydrolase [Mycoplasmataceae bacterium]